MTGPEHYLEAERLVVTYAGMERPTEQEIARAQVHATLAQAAATALGASAICGGVGVDVAAWDKACGVQP